LKFQELGYNTIPSGTTKCRDWAGMSFHLGTYFFEKSISVETDIEHLKVFKEMEYTSLVLLARALKSMILIGMYKKPDGF